MNKIISTHLIVTSVVITIIASACGYRIVGNNAPTLSLPPTSTQLPIDYSPTQNQQTFDSITPTLPTMTPILAVPEAAGPITPDLRLTFHTDLEDLPSGDFFILAEGDRNQINFDAFSWDGSVSFPLVTISGDEDSRMGGGQDFDPVTMEILGLYRDDQVHDGLYAIDLQSQKLGGFEFGCDELWQHLLPSYLISNCNEHESELFFISRDTWEIAFGREYFEIGKNEFTGFSDARSDEFYILRGDYDIGLETICTIESTNWTTENCQVFEPFYSGEFSPDGKWIEIQRGGDDGFRFGYMSTDCLIDMWKECVEVWIEDAPFTNRGDITPNVAWSPASDKLVYIKAGCTGEDNATFWVYDLASTKSRVLATLPACHNFVYLNSKPLWSPDGSKVAVERTGRGYYQLDISTGQVSSLFTDDPYADIIGSFSVP